nr:hypothetical protein [Micromonospora sp. DSM 115978]
MFDDTATVEHDDVVGEPADDTGDVHDHQQREVIIAAWPVEQVVISSQISQQACGQQNACGATCSSHRPRARQNGC